MIRLYKHYKYDNNYDYIKLFSTKEEQDQYFNSLEQLIIYEESYTKENLGTILIDYSLDYLVNEGINYLMFNNGYKDYYGFITQKDYISDDCTRISYEIDVMQTYLFDIHLNNSFVERKVCSIDEISDFDEGLYLGEHEIEEDIVAFEKESTYFAMFNGFKEQQLIFDGTILKSVVDLPFSSSKPLTVVDNIQYPVYFMPLKETYKNATYDKIGLPSSGETVGGTLSAKMFRVIKGIEGFAQYPNYFNNESFRTGGYGITELYQPKYFEMLGNAPYTEQKASEVLEQMLRNNFVNPLYERMLRDGLVASQIKQRHFDAFLSLSMNGGLGAVTDSPMYSKYLVNQDDETIATDWLTWYIKDDTGLDNEGLKNRRKKESDIFQYGTYEYLPIAIYGMSGQNTGLVVTDNNGNGFIPTNLNGGV